MAENSVDFHPGAMISIFSPSDNVLDVPEAELHEGLTLYPDFHGGDNQVFIVGKVKDDKYELISLCDEESRLGSSGEQGQLEFKRPDDEHWPSFNASWKLRGAGEGRFSLALTFGNSDLYLMEDQEENLGKKDTSRESSVEFNGDDACSVEQDFRN